MSIQCAAALTAGSSPRILAPSENVVVARAGGPTLTERIAPDTPLFWSSWGQPRQGKIRRPITGKNIWRLCKTYGRIIGYPMLKPHDLRHGAMEILEQHHDLEAVRAMLGHTRI
jgi:hypothetical protein